MSFEQLQQLWAAQTMGSLPLPDKTVLVEKVKIDSQAFDRLIARRDWREIYASLFLTAFYALPARQPQGPAWAYWISVGAMLGLTAFFFALRYHAWRSHREVTPTLTGELEWSITHTRQQIRLLTHVAWWYLLPLLIAAFSHTLYRHANFALQDWLVGCLLLVVFAAVYWLNQRAVRTKLQPQLDELTVLRDQWQALGQDENSGKP